MAGLIIGLPVGFFMRADALFKIAAQAGAVIFIVFHDGTGDAVYQVGGFAGATGEEPDTEPDTEPDGEPDGE